jgi:apolipoprotein N-acyltransferase
MIFTIDPIRNFLSYRPNLTCLFAGISAGLIQPPLFCFWAIVGFTIFAFQIHSSQNISEVLKRHFAFGFGFFGYGFYWIVIAISIRLSEFWWAVPIALFGMPLIFILHTLFATLVAWKFRNNTHYPLIFALAWVFIEWVTSFIFSGLPWMIVAYGIGFSDILSQSANIVSIYGVSLVILYVSFQFYYIFYRDQKIKLSGIFLSTILIAIIAIFGYFKLAKFPIEFTNVRARIVQPTTNQLNKLNIEEFWQGIHKQSKLSQLNARITPDIIIWPESAIAANYKNPQIFDHVANIAKEMDAILMMGTISVEGKKYYNSFVGISPEGDVLFDYRKKHLVPFGEYVPLKKYLPINKLTFGVADYSYGSGKEVFYIDKINMKIRPLICYESLFPHEINGDEADVFINVTNTAWYGNSTAPHHLFYVNKFRAIENSTPIIVSSNNGVSGMFDSQGRLIAKTNLNDIIALDLYVPRKMGNKLITPLTGFLILIMALFSLGYLGNRYEKSKY